MHKLIIEDLIFLLKVLGSISNIIKINYSETILYKDLWPLP